MRKRMPVRPIERAEAEVKRALHDAKASINRRFGRFISQAVHEAKRLRKIGVHPGNAVRIAARAVLRQTAQETGLGCACEEMGR